MLAATTKYALRVLIYLSQQPVGEFTSLEILADKTEISSPYLRKLIISLAAKQLVETRKGPNGGVKTIDSRPPLSFWDVCSALDDPLVSDECILFKSPCNPENPCSFHNNWKVTKEEFKKFLATSKCEEGERPLLKL